MSNKFNKLTQQLRRPKVCKPPPPPIGTVIKCEIDDTEIVMIPMSDQLIEGKAINESLDLMTVVDATGDFVAEITAIGEGENDFNPFNITIENDEVPGVYNGSIVFTFENGSKCSTPLKVTIDDM